MAFGELYGHEKAIAILKNAMANNRIAHAYLFYGMEGIGKRTVASLFARALNCEGDPLPATPAHPAGRHSTKTTPTSSRSPRKASSSRSGRLRNSRNR